MNNSFPAPVETRTTHLYCINHWGRERFERLHCFSPWNETVHHSKVTAWWLWPFQLNTHLGHSSSVDFNISLWTYENVVCSRNLNYINVVLILRNNQFYCHLHLQCLLCLFSMVYKNSTNNGFSLSYSHLYSLMKNMWSSFKVIMYMFLFSFSFEVF